MCFSALADLYGGFSRVTLIEEDKSNRESKPQENTDKTKSSDNDHAVIPDQDAVIKAISTVHDPEIPVDIYALGLIYAIDLHEGGEVDIDMTLTAPNCPSAQELPLAVKDAVQAVPNVTKVKVNIVWDPPWDISRMSDEARILLNLF